jgi:ABC-2 type transport system ATP-binding protein
MSNVRLYEVPAGVVPPAPAAPDDVIDTDRLDLHYGRRQALSNLSLRIPRGGIHALVGANGAGKTSLFRVLLGFQSPTGGRGYTQNHRGT